MRDLRFFSPQGEVDPSPGGDGRIWVTYNITDTENATNIIANTTAIGPTMLVDDTPVPLSTTYLFDTEGLHTVKFRYNKGTALYRTFQGVNIVDITFPKNVTVNTNRDNAPLNIARISGNVYVPGTINAFPINSYGGAASLNIEVEINGLTNWTGYCTPNSIKSLIVRGTFSSIPGNGISGFNSTNAFRYIEIESPNLTSIDNYNFRNMSKVETVIIKVDTPPTFTNAANCFTSFNNNAKIYVPYSVDHSILAAYQAADVWSTRASQMYELNPDGTIPTT